MNHIISPEFTLQKHKLQKEVQGFAQTRKGSSNCDVIIHGQRRLNCHRSFEIEKGSAEYVSK